MLWHCIFSLSDVACYLQAPLLLCIWDSVKPKFDAEAAKRPARPVQYNLDEEEDNLDDIMANIASVRNIRIGK